MFSRAVNAKSIGTFMGDYYKRAVSVTTKYVKDRHGGLGRDSWLLHVNVYP